MPKKKYPVMAKQKKKASCNSKKNYPVTAKKKKYRLKAKKSIMLGEKKYHLAAKKKVSCNGQKKYPVTVLK